jgi:RimJ/RimL family protein N-acetyltransferase
VRLAARARLVARKFLTVTFWVFVDNERAIRFYEAAGFAPNQNTLKEISVGGKSLREIRYEAAIG